ncbi:hypothetical protein [Nostoc sp.]|uniref:hypothetical protein n=1 Tax=Nostoc sp. TaxID=1180 RepID=UPI002FF6341F
MRFFNDQDISNRCNKTQNTITMTLYPSNEVTWVLNKVRGKNSIENALLITRETLRTASDEQLDAIQEGLKVMDEQMVSINKYIVAIGY